MGSGSVDNPAFIALHEPDAAVEVIFPDDGDDPLDALARVPDGDLVLPADLEFEAERFGPIVEGKTKPVPGDVFRQQIERAQVVFVVQDLQLDGYRDRDSPFFALYFPIVGH